MTIDKKLLQIAIASVISSGLALTATSAIAATAAKMEKCYGINKTSKNDCGTKSHACAGLAKTSNNPNEWIFVPAGTCISPRGGSLQPGDANNTKTDTPNK